ncbi:MAG: dienelactone hydrolase family protein [Hyphomicrobiaceae bacterium]
MAQMRRTITLSMAVLSGILTAGPEVRAASQTVTFPSEQLDGRTKTLTIRGRLSKPKGNGPFPAVVLLPNCGGPATYEFAQFWPAYLNQLGYVTLNVDPFAPRKARRCSKKFRPSMESVAQDAFGALSYLATLPGVDARKVAVIGSSLGAHVIIAFAGKGHTTKTGLTFKAAVSLYPVSCRRLVVSAAMIPTLVIQGDRERGVRSCRRYAARAVLRAKILENTYHGFDQPSATRRRNGRLRTDIGGNKRLYSRSATRTAQALVKDFLTLRLTASEETPRPDRNSAPLGNVGGRNPYRAVRRRDSDGDGRVSAAEWERSPRIFSRIDANEDGYLTAQEFFDHWQRRLR